MFKKSLAIITILFSSVFIFTPTANAQETAAESHLFQVMLPAGAQRVTPGSVPAEISDTLARVTAAGAGKFRQGDTEVLVWAGNYQKANAGAIVNRLTGSLKNAGWQYAIEGEEGGVTVFSLFKNSPRRAIVGFYGATDEALILAAMEILPNNGIGSTQNNDATENGNDFEAAPVKRNGNSGGSIVGEWGNVYISRTGYQPKLGPPSFTPSKRRVWTYNFHPNGTYTFTGLMEITLAGCTTTYFQDKRGRYTINGNQITLTLTKNLWRKGESCAASGNKESEGEHKTETYTLSLSRNENGKEQVCLDSGDGEGSLVCYERKK